MPKKLERVKDMEQHILQTDKGRVFYWQSDHWDVNKDTLQHDGEKYFRYK